MVDAVATKTLPALRAGFPSDILKDVGRKSGQRHGGVSCRQDKGVRCSCSQAHLYAVLHVGFLAVDVAAQSFQRSVEVQYSRDPQRLYGSTGVSATFRKGAIYA